MRISVMVAHGPLTPIEVVQIYYPQPRSTVSSSYDLYKLNRTRSIRICSLMVKHKISNLRLPVRFWSDAPKANVSKI